jgi:hypothetical protein
MIFNVDVKLSSLFCGIPTDSDGDDPYLLTYFVKLDGTNVRQRPGDWQHFTGTVDVIAPSGGPGDLDARGVQSGRSIPVPPELGTWSTVLKPIIIDVPGIRFFAPGTVIVFAIAVAEEGLPHHITFEVFRKVVPFVRDRVNAFINGIDLLEVQQSASQAGQPVPDFLRGRINQFAEDLKHTVHNYVHDEFEQAILSEIFSLSPFERVTGIVDAISSIDPDEPLGNGAHIAKGEDELLNNGLAVFWTGTMKADKGDPASGEYDIHGALSANIRFTSADISGGDAPTTVTAPAGMPITVTFQKDHIMVCVYAGTTVQLTSYSHTQTYAVRREYPFATYRYSIAGQVLDLNLSSILIRTMVRFQQFNEDSTHPARPFIEDVEQERAVTVHFSSSVPANAPQLQVLSITNDPADGSYDIDLQVDFVVPGSGGAIVIPVATVPLSFTGQTLEFPADFAEHMKQCLSNFIGTRWAKSKRFNPRDPGPAERLKQFEEIARQLDRLAATGAFQKSNVEVAKKVIAAKLKLQVPGL